MSHLRKVIRPGMYSGSSSGEHLYKSNAAFSGAEPFANLSRQFNGVDPVLYLASKGGGLFDAEYGPAMQTPDGAGVDPAENVGPPFTDGVTKGVEFAIGKWWDEVATSTLIGTGPHIAVELISRHDINGPGGNSRHFGCLLTRGLFVESQSSNRVRFGITDAAGQRLWVQQPVGGAPAGVFNYHLVVFDIAGASTADRMVATVDGVDVTAVIVDSATIAGTIDGEAGYAVGNTRARRDTSTSFDGVVGLVGLWAGNLGLPGGGGNAAHVAAIAAARYAQLPI